jgi:hypothetical protein
VSTSRMYSCPLKVCACRTGSKPHSDTSHAVCWWNSTPILRNAAGIVYVYANVLSQGGYVRTGCVHRRLWNHGTNDGLVYVSERGTKYSVRVLCGHPRVRKVNVPAAPGTYDTRPDLPAPPAPLNKLARQGAIPLALLARHTPALAASSRAAFSHVNT